MELGTKSQLLFFLGEKSIRLAEPKHEKQLDGGLLMIPAVKCGTTLRCVALSFWYVA